MDPTSIDLRSISCKGIKSFNLFQKPATFAVVSVVDPSNPGPSHKRKTAADLDGGEDPEWTESFRFDLGGGDLALEIEIMVHGNVPLLLGERVVGRVHVPIADLLTEGRDGSVRHVSYRVVGTDGKPNGIIGFSYNINYPAAVSLPAASSFPPTYQLDPVVPAPVGNYYPPPEPVVSLAASGYYPPPDQQYPMIWSPVSDCYPPPRMHDPVAPVPASGWYPPPRQQAPVNAFPTANYSFQPHHLVSSPASDCYPPPRQQELVVGAVTGYPPAGLHAAYPPPSAPPECCYPAPPQRDGYVYRPESWDHTLHR